MNGFNNSSDEAIADIVPRNPWQNARNSLNTVHAA
jgi:hypothetical protein